jgi:alginate O-acetyltransferase complex protein AlgI
LLFNSLQFALFIPVVLGLYFLLSHKRQNRMLLVASYIFYGSWDWHYLLLIFFSTAVNYYCGLGIYNSACKKNKKNLLSISIFTNLSLLWVFKYYYFFAESFQVLLGNFGLTVQPYILHVALPIGISFYTFQTMSYTIDVYRGKLTPTKNLFDFALFVSFFPQLIAGPIERGARLLPQILEKRTTSIEKFKRGAFLFLWGFFLKVFIADNLALLVDSVFDGRLGGFKGIDVVLATYAFSYQIYCDFAGYSFMAIGLALCMGIELTENFRRPYFSQNISDFWRRWHITLSSWFKDYVYIPLGGNRQGIVRQSYNLGLTFILCGLWHGAEWKFIFFGLYHAIMIAIYYLIEKHWDRLNKFFQIFLTYHIICIGWMIFRGESFSKVLEMLQSIFINFSITLDEIFFENVSMLLFFTFILIVVEIFQHKYNDNAIVFRLHWVPRYSFFALLIFLTIAMASSRSRQFIYFQF